MHLRTILCAITVGLLVTSAYGQETQRQYLSGKGTDDAVPWEFFCTAGAKSGQWTTIPVPSCWDALGFGTLNYSHDGDAPEQGKYRHRFRVPQEWRDRRVVLVFDGVLTDTQASINGNAVGEKHQGGFYRFEYDVTSSVKFGEENLLEVTVDKKSANDSINRAERQSDYWLFGGIFRPVWIEARPAQHVERLAIDARADGTLSVDVFTKGGNRVEANVKGIDGPSPAADVKDGKATLQAKLTAPRTWTAETPNLYDLDVRLLDGDGKVLHRVTQRFGFRTVEVRKGDGIYVNGKRVLLKGTNRHSFWPDSGRALSEKISRQDVKLMKEMNCNAVRMSHYPPDEHFLDACDELGLYVLDELGGWQKSYDTPTATRLVGAMIRRDVNHPSILFWDNGNEGGWNTAVDGEFAKWDPQKRHVLHPWELHDDVNTKHYRSYDEHVKLSAGPDVFLPTEFLHGLFDGGGGAGLADYWDVTRKSKFAGGGFIWAWVDETVKRPDGGAMGGKMDTAGNRAPDGVVGPYREKEGSFYAMKEIWSPVVVRRVSDAELEVENRYDFTNLNQCRFTLERRDFSRASDERAEHVMLQSWTPKLTAAPGKTVRYRLPNLSAADAVALSVEDPNGREVWTWVWPLREAKLNKADGGDASWFRRHVRLAGPGEMKQTEWRDLPGGGVELSYAYALDGTVDFHGVSFDLPEKDLQSIRWLGQGPFRVWKNRLAGNTLGVWETKRNDTVTGYEGWQYPEFAGCYAGVRWMRIETAAGPVIMEMEDPSLFVQVGKVTFPGDPKPFSPTTAATRRAPTSQLSGNAWANLPDAGLSILHAIPPIGTKFQLANTTGPMGAQNVAKGEYRGRVRFYFARK